ncbi:MAG TPA: hypothetical protein VKV04_21665 [Verrucomicrobiae bacterium]|nr:hypothetical protein [Verrucomicrobiae bacterium]
MKFLRVEDDHSVFHLEKGEKELFIALLRQYPIIPPAHHRLSKSTAPANTANQKLLDDALAEQRKENKILVAAFLADPQRFSETDAFCRLRLTAAETEWLLQVLNDIRVGSWILAGSPEELPHLIFADLPTPEVWTMELAGDFQMSLLKKSGENGEKPE